MNRMKKSQKFDLIKSIRDYFHITPYMPIMEWIDSNISYSDDVSAERSKPDFTQYPFQVDIIKQWEDMNSRKRVVVTAIEQVGKTNMMVLGLLYRMVYDPCQSMCVYPSDTKCQEMNLTKIQPLIKHIPRT